MMNDMRKFFDILDSRFCKCFDGVIHQIVVTYQNKSRYPDVQIEIETKDIQAVTGWSILVLFLKSVEEFKFVEGKSTYRILNDGINLIKKNEFWIIKFEDLELVDSNFYIRFKEGQFSLKSIAER
jgi:hypothetical protein